MLNRRGFLKQTVVGAGLLALGQFPFRAFGRSYTTKLTILHTNDVHSHLEPFPSTDKNYPGLGGVARRAELIKQIRNQEKNILLFDSGDFFQGTPYFNLFQGEPEILSMNLMQYDAVTLGNHEFDLGLDNLATQLNKAKFPVLNANYDFQHEQLKNLVKPYKIFKIENLRIGVFGLGVQLYGLVPQEAYGKTKYHDPIQVANEIGSKLKEQHRCDFIICLSHLGYDYPFDKPSDIKLAQHSKYIDVILGGHTHTFLDEPRVEINLQGREVFINQVGWAGIRLGRLDFYFDEKKNFFSPKFNTVIIGK